MDNTNLPQRGNLLVGQSGGPTAAINATLSGVIRAARASGVIPRIYGALNGVEGLLEGRICDLDGVVPDEENLCILQQTPAAVLGSCRKRLAPPEGDPAQYEQLLAILRAYDIRYFFYIGGNDSMDTVAKVAAYAQAHGWPLSVVGIPKTIDNDLAGTDHSPGFGSAAKYVAVTVQEVLQDCAVYTVPAVTIVEIMGRDVGWLTAASGLPGVISGLGPDHIYIPERTFTWEQFYADVEESLARHPNVVLAVSEGIRFADGKYVGASMQSGAVDRFGHAYLAGTARVLQQAVKERFGCKVRSIELNTPQRCAAHLLSGTDIEESVAIGRAAVEAALRGETGIMVGFVCDRADGGYACRIESRPVADIANKVRALPDDYITPDGRALTPAGVAYLKPLIQGELQIRYREGLPQHVVMTRGEA